MNNRQTVRGKLVECACNRAFLATYLAIRHTSRVQRLMRPMTADTLVPAMFAMRPWAVLELGNE